MADRSDPGLVAAGARGRARRELALSVAFVLGSFAALVFGYRTATPLFEAPDEPSHLHYAVFVYEHERLPRQDPLEVPGEGMQPPLAYWIAAPLLRATSLDTSFVASVLHELNLEIYHWRPAPVAHAALALSPEGARQFRSDGRFAALAPLRALSGAFALLAVIATLAAAWRISGDARFTLLAGALLAFNPQLGFVSGYFSNDPLAVAVGAAALWVVADAIARGGPARGHYVAGALLIALGTLAKTSTLPGLGAAALTIAAIDRRAVSARVRDIALAAAIAALFCTPYLLWAAKHRGGLFGIDALYASAESLRLPAGGRLDYLVRSYSGLTFQSYWCYFGWMNVVAPVLVYVTLLALCVVGVVGSFSAGRRSAADPLASKSLRTYLLGAVAATAAAHLVLNLTVVAAQGRHLFATAPQFALLLALGIDRIVLDERRMRRIALVVAVALLALDVYCLRFVLVPAYAPAS